MKRVGFGFCVLALAGGLAGCAINDPTENEFAPRIINNTRSTATIVYCNGISSCGTAAWTERLRPGQTTSDSINAGHGSLAVLVVTQDRVRRCIRLARFTKGSECQRPRRAACNRPYA